MNRSVRTCSGKEQHKTTIHIKQQATRNTNHHKNINGETTQHKMTRQRQTHNIHVVGRSKPTSSSRMIIIHALCTCVYMCVYTCVYIYIYIHTHTTTTNNNTNNDTNNHTIT